MPRGQQAAKRQRGEGHLRGKGDVQQLNKNNESNSIPINPAMNPYTINNIGVPNNQFMQNGFNNPTVNPAQNPMTIYSPYNNNNMMNYNNLALQQCAFFNMYNMMKQNANVTAIARGPALQSQNQAVPVPNRCPATPAQQISYIGHESFVEEMRKRLQQATQVQYRTAPGEDRNEGNSAELTAAALHRLEGTPQQTEQLGSPNTTTTNRTTPHQETPDGIWYQNRSIIPQEKMQHAEIKQVLKRQQGEESGRLLYPSTVNIPQVEEIDVFEEIVDVETNDDEPALMLVSAGVEMQPQEDEEVSYKEVEDHTEKKKAIIAQPTVHFDNKEAIIEKISLANEKICHLGQALSEPKEIVNDYEIFGNGKDVTSYSSTGNVTVKVGGQDVVNCTSTNNGATGEVAKEAVFHDVRYDETCFQTVDESSSKKLFPQSIFINTNMVIKEKTEEHSHFGDLDGMEVMKVGEQSEQGVEEENLAQERLDEQLAQVTAEENVFGFHKKHNVGEKLCQPLQSQIGSEEQIQNNCKAPHVLQQLEKVIKEEAYGENSEEKEFEFRETPQGPKKVKNTENSLILQYHMPVTMSHEDIGLEEEADSGSDTDNAKFFVEVNRTTKKKVITQKEDKPKTKGIATKQKLSEPSVQNTQRRNRQLHGTSQIDNEEVDEGKIKQEVVEELLGSAVGEKDRALLLGYVVENNMIVNPRMRRHSGSINSLSSTLQMQWDKKMKATKVEIDDSSDESSDKTLSNSSSYSQKLSFYQKRKHTPQEHKEEKQIKIEIDDDDDDYTMDENEPYISSSNSSCGRNLRGRMEKQREKKSKPKKKKAKEGVTYSVSKMSPFEIDQRVKEIKETRSLYGKYFNKPNDEVTNIIFPQQRNKFLQVRCSNPYTMNSEYIPYDRSPMIIKHTTETIGECVYSISGENREHGGSLDPKLNHYNFQLGDVVWAEWNGHFWPGTIYALATTTSDTNGIQNDCIVQAINPTTNQGHLKWLTNYDTIELFDHAFHRLILHSCEPNPNYVPDVADAILLKGTIGYFEEFMPRKVFVHMMREPKKYYPILSHVPERLLRAWMEHCHIERLDTHKTRSSKNYLTNENNPFKEAIDKMPKIVYVNTEKTGLPVSYKYNIRPPFDGASMALKIRDFMERTGKYPPLPSNIHTGLKLLLVSLFKHQLFSINEFFLKKVEKDKQFPLPKFLENHEKVRKLCGEHCPPENSAKKMRIEFMQELSAHEVEFEDVTSEKMKYWLGLINNNPTSSNPAIKKTGNSSLGSTFQERAENEEVGEGPAVKKIKNTSCSKE